MIEHEIVEYHVEVDGTKVTMVLIVNSPEAANKLGNTLTARFKGHVVNEIPVDNDMKP